MLYIYIYTYTHIHVSFVHVIPKLTVNVSVVVIVSRRTHKCCYLKINCLRQVFSITGEIIGFLMVKKIRFIIFRL